MAVHKNLEQISYPAAADLSSAQFRLVSMDGNGRVNTVADGNTAPFGVLCNKPSALGAGAQVAIEGSDVKLEAGAAMNEGDLIVAVTGGRGSPLASGTASGTTWVAGVCTQAASGSGAIGAILLRPYFHVRP